MSVTVLREKLYVPNEDAPVVSTPAGHNGQAVIEHVVLDVKLDSRLISLKIQSAIRNLSISHVTATLNRVDHGIEIKHPGVIGAHVLPHVTVEFVIDTFLILEIQTIQKKNAKIFKRKSVMKNHVTSSR